MSDKDTKKKDAEASEAEESDDGLNPMGMAGDALNMDNYFPPADDEEFKSHASDTGAPVLQQCCCCICNCQTKATEGVTCCCLVPIKCGITTIGVLTIALAAVEISAQFFLMLNDQVKWWYCLVNLILLVPTYIAAAYFIVWFGKDSVATRGNLACASIMVIVSASLLAAWAIIYFVWIHEGDTVYYGWGTTEEGYVKYQKRYYLFRELAWGIIVVALYSYFICICNRYAKLLRLARTKEEKDAYKKQKEDEKRAEDALDAKAKNGGVTPKVKKEKKKKAKDSTKEAAAEK